MAELKERLRNLRDSQGKNQIQVAAELGMKQATYSSYENGVTPKTEILAKIASHYSVSMDYLLGLSNERRPTSGELASLFSSIAALAGEDAISSDMLALLIKSIIQYYKIGAPCGDIPMKALIGFVEGMRIALDATAAADLPSMIDGSSAAATAALQATKMPGIFKIEKNRK